jgi:hypothetical protein
MNDRQESEHVTTTEARGASTPHVGRWVLSLSMILIIVLFAIILFVGW